MTPAFTQLRLPTPYLASLSWSGDTLIDWVHGGKTYRLDGSIVETHRGYSYPFDAATMSPSGAYAFLYQRLGTKGLLLDARTGRILREINRSCYHAHVYEYPVALFDLPDGREVIAHCPDAYDRIHIEVIATGERLTAHGRRERAADFFHSRLTVNRARTRLLSAGWVWQPVDVAMVYGLRRALEDPASLDDWNDDGPPTHTDLSAVFLDDDRLLVSSAKEAFDYEDEPQSTYLKPGMIGVYDLNARAYLSLATAAEEVGTMMPVGRHHVVGFYDHPKLIEIETGRLVHAWPELKSGKQIGSIIWHQDPPPALALDPASHRFAVGEEQGISVVQFIDVT
jgi:hypothetical protein